MTTTPLFPLDGHVVERLQADQAPEVQSLCEACHDYHERLEGAPAGPEAGESTFAALPPGNAYDDKYVIGLRDGAGSLIGVIDLIRNYPEPGVWYIGLLLLHPAHRGRGVGQATVSALAAWVQTQGGVALGLGVVNQNKTAVRFWRAAGFKELNRRLMRFGSKDSIVLVMRRTLG